MTAILLNSLLPIFTVMALGYFAGWVRDIDNQHVGELNAQPPLERARWGRVS